MIIGMDFGTTNSSVYAIQDGEAVCINKNGTGIPSVVAFTDNGPLVGEAAQKQAVTNPKRTISGIIRLLGRKYNSAEMEAWARHAPYDIVPLPNGDAGIHIYGRIYHPSELVALVLGQLKAEAEAYFEGPVSEVVISVPTPFNALQRQAIRDAGRIAGLVIQRVLVGSTAAALTIGAEEHGNKKIAVVDLGGGTLDITIAEIGEGIVETRSVNGDASFGGEDFDQILVDYLVDEFAKETDIDLSKNDMALQRLKEAAENARKDLSTARETEIRLPFIAVGKEGPKNLESRLGRPTLETLVSEAVGKLENFCRQTLTSAGLSPKDIDKVYLLGGLGRMPLLQNAVREIFGKNPERPPAGVVGRGAALQGGILSGDVDASVALLLDCITYSLGIETEDGKVKRILERNETIPIRRTLLVSAPPREAFAINVLQGDNPLARDNVLLARLELDGLEVPTGETPQLEVTFDIDSSRVLIVSAKDRNSGRVVNVKAVPAGLPEEEIIRLRREFEARRKLSAANFAREQALELLSSKLEALRELSESGAALEGAREEALDAAADLVRSLRGSGA